MLLIYQTCLQTAKIKCQGHDLVTIGIKSLIDYGWPDLRGIQGSLSLPLREKVHLQIRRDHLRLKPKTPAPGPVGKNSRTLVSSRVILKFEKLSTDRNIIITRAGMCLNDTSSLCFEDEFLADLTFSFSFVIKRQSLCQESEKKTHTCHVTQFKFN